MMNTHLNDSTLQLSKDSQAWLDSMLKHTRYCHYFSVCLAKDDVMLMGSWNAPFYTIEEAHQFKRMMQAKFPDQDLICIEGATCTDGAMKNTPNKFWAIWQKKHKEHIVLLKDSEVQA